MEGYPDGSLELNLPYIVVAGLSSDSSEELPLNPALNEQRILLRSDLPNLDSEDASFWRQYIQSQDARDRPWSPQDDSKTYRFRVTVTGRVKSIYKVACALSLSDVLLVSCPPAPSC